MKTVQENSRYHFSDRVAAKFAEQFDGSLRFIKPYKEWYKWRDETFWDKVDEDYIYNCFIAGDLGREQIKLYLNEGNNEEADRYAQCLYKPAIRNSIFDQLYKTLGEESFIPPPVYEIAYPHGILDLRTGYARLPNKSVDNHTSMIRIPYIPDSTTGDDRIESLLNIWFPDKEVRSWLELAIGQAMHCMAGGERHFICVVGNTSSGKTTLFSSLIGGILEPYAKRGVELADFYNIQRISEHNIVLAEILDQKIPLRFLIAAETGDQRFPSKIVKAITGEELLKARRPYSKNHVSGRINALFICYGISPPRFTFDSDLNRCLRVVRMDSYLSRSEQDPNLSKRFIDPFDPLSQAGLRWIVRCSVRFWNTCPTRKLPPPPVSMLEEKKQCLLCYTDSIHASIYYLREEKGSLIGMTVTEVQQSDEIFEEISLNKLLRWLNKNGYVIKLTKKNGKVAKVIVKEPDI